MTPLKTRILIADDHPIVLNGLRTVLDAPPALEVVAQASEVVGPRGRERGGAVNECDDAYDR